MKLIIDISEEDRKDIGNIHFVREDLKFKIGKAIMNGTPLDDVKAEIDEKISHYEHFSSSNTANGLMIAKEIIEKYKGDKE